MGVLRCRACVFGLLACLLLTEWAMPIRGVDPPAEGKSLAVSGLENGMLVRHTSGVFLTVDGNRLEDLSSDQVAALRLLDEVLAASPKPERRIWSAAVLEVLGRSGDEQALLHVHQVYESDPARREDVAWALTRLVERGRRRMPDWRVLVRSLKIVEGAQARAVMQALARFRQRANKSAWIRQAILVGLAQNEAGQTDAIRLLEGWTGKQQGNADEPASARLASWSAWFAKQYPDAPPAELPKDAPGSRWKLADVQRALGAAKEPPNDAQAGWAAFEKAQCAKCHQFGARGEKLGPDLTNVSRRLQRKEILLETMFPSYDLSDEYSSVRVQTRQGIVHAGMMTKVDVKTITIVGADAKQTVIAKSDVEQIQSDATSIMPAGLLEPLTLEEIVALFAYMQHPPEPR